MKTLAYRARLFLASLFTLLGALGLLYVLTTTGCTPRARVAAVEQVFAETDLICAVLGYDNGAELKVCRAAGELARLLAEVGLGMTEAASAPGDTSAVPDLAGPRLMPPGAKRLVRVELRRVPAPPPSPPPDE